MTGSIAPSARPNRAAGAYAANATERRLNSPESSTTGPTNPAWQPLRGRVVVPTRNWKMTHLSAAAGITCLVLGLPDKIEGLLFDMDGVLTQTAKVHAAAWKQTFDEFLRKRAQEQGEKFVPFDV